MFSEFDLSTILASLLKPVVYKVQRIRDGKSFASRYVTAHQDDKIVFSVQVSFHLKEESAISHQYTMPTVEEPEKLKNQWQLAREYLSKSETGEIQLTSFNAIEMRAKLDGEKKTLVEVNFLKITTINHYSSRFAR